MIVEVLIRSCWIRLSPGHRASLLSAHSETQCWTSYFLNVIYYMVSLETPVLHQFPLCFMFLLIWFFTFSKYKLAEMWSCFCDTSFKTRIIWFLRIRWKTPERNPDVDLIPLSDWDKNKLLNVLNFLFIVSSVAGEQMKPAVLTKQTTFMIGTIKLYSKYKMCWSDAVEQTEEKKNMFSEIQSCCRDVLVGRGQFWFCSGSVLVLYWISTGVFGS